jgi:hypothetical protein
MRCRDPFANACGDVLRDNLRYFDSTSKTRGWVIGISHWYSRKKRLVGDGLALYDGSYRQQQQV